MNSKQTNSILRKTRLILGAALLLPACALAGNITYTVENSSVLSGTVVINGTTVVSADLDYIFNSNTYIFTGTPQSANEVSTSYFYGNFIDGSGDTLYLDINASINESGTYSLCTTSSYCQLGPPPGTASDFDEGCCTHSTLTSGDLTPAASTPEPASIALFGTGLAVLGVFRRRRQRISIRSGGARQKPTNIKNQWVHLCFWPDSRCRRRRAR